MDELQKTIDTELKKNAASGKKTFSGEQMEDIILTSDETKIKVKQPLPPESKEAVVEVKDATLNILGEEKKTVESNGNVTFGEFVEDKTLTQDAPPPPKTIADLLSIEAAVAKNPPKAAPSQNKLKENLKSISYAHKEDSPIVKRLRTLKGDVAEAMQSGKATMVSMASAEVVRQSEQKRNIEKAVLTQSLKTEAIPTVKRKSSKSLIFLSLFVSLLLIGGGVGGLYYFKYLALRPVKVIELPSATSYIPIQFEAKIITDKHNSSFLRAAVAAIRQGKQGTLNEAGVIYLAKTDTSSKTGARPLSTKEFLSAFEIRAPEELSRTLDPNFMLGLHLFSENQSFLIFKTDAYESAVSGMYAFEFNLEEDLGKLLRTPSDFAYATTTDALTNRRTFKDVYIKNNDARAIYNDKNEILFFYTFLKDRETLIMATNPETLEKILNGLSSRTEVK